MVNRLAQSQSLRHLYDTDKPKLGSVKSQILEALQQFTLLSGDDSLRGALLARGLGLSGVS